VRAVFCWLNRARPDTVERHESPLGADRGMIDVALTRTDMRGCDVAVVVDVLRATSVATQALAGGYECVLFTDSLERARALREPDRVLAGERHCVMPAGFDQGNSPLDVLLPRGRELVLATTNGAPAILAAARLAPTVLLACLLNLAAVLDALGDTDWRANDLQLVCAGTDGAAALEDTYVAGRLSSGLTGPRTDASRVAQAVARGFVTPLEALSHSDDARVLRASGMEADISHCATESVLDVVPRVISADTEVAVTADRRGEALRSSAVDVPATVEV
jgi:phosphosulfolactate phosphohydrolase-like enzyme